MGVRKRVRNTSSSSIRSASGCEGERVGDLTASVIGGRGHG